MIVYQLSNEPYCWNTPFYIFVKLKRLASIGARITQRLASIGARRVLGIALKKLQFYKLPFPKS
ncbi:hypothetical protein C4Q31_04635 [Leptospira borgpetersenii serovar Ceylonica]|nr:hypothetical protein C4Q31_04635 [Leptospira borgpetersenii serovar Ceylonica]